MPLKPMFLSGKLANLPQRIQERSASSEDGIECVLSDFDDDTGKKQKSVWWKKWMISTKEICAFCVYFLPPLKSFALDVKS